MKRLCISFLIFIGYASVTGSAYLVHEEPVEIPVPVSTSETIDYSKNQQQDKLRNSLNVSLPPDYLQSIHNTHINSVNELQYESNKKSFQMQLEQQRVYQRQRSRDFMKGIIKHTREVQEKIYKEDERTNHRFYRDPFSFNILTDSLIELNRNFSKYGGHGDGHVYQYYNQRKPLHFGGHQEIHQKRINNLLSVPPSLPVSSNISNSNRNDTSANRSSVQSARTYEVTEVVDESSNPFPWPNWFGIISKSSPISQSDNIRIDKKIGSQLMKVKFEELPLRNKMSLKSKNIFKSKYGLPRKIFNQQKFDVTRNEIDGTVKSNESVRKNVYHVKVLTIDSI